MGFFSITKNPPEPEKKKWCKCKQPDYEVRNQDDCLHTHCKKCDGMRFMPDLLNNLIERVKRLEAESVTGNTCNDASWKPE